MKETDFFLIVIVLTPLLIILFLFLLKEVVSYIFRVPEEYKRQKKKEQLEKQGDEIEEQFTSQFSPENLSNYDQWMNAFCLNTKPFSEIPEETKREIISENTKGIEGLSEEDRQFVAKMLYDIVVEGNSNGESRILRNFLFEKLKLKFKKNADQIVRYQNHKACCQFHRLELLQYEFKKAKWIFLGGSCSIEKHKFLHGIIFNLETGFYDDELNKYIFPTDLENCDCDFVIVHDYYDNEDIEEEE